MMTPPLTSAHPRCARALKSPPAPLRAAVQRARAWSLPLLLSLTLSTGAALAQGQLQTQAQAQAPAPAAAATPAAVRAEVVADAAREDPARRLHALFAQAWEWSAQALPEYASYRGDHRFGDRLSSTSAAAIAARDEMGRHFLRRAQAIPRAALGERDRVSLDIFIDGLQRQQALAAYPAARGMTLRALGGPQTQFAELLQVMPVDTEAQVQQMLARMETAFPQRMGEDIERLRRSAAAGWVPTRAVLQRVLAQIEPQLAAQVQGTPFYAPFTHLGAALDAPTRQALQARARTAIAERVQPALRQLQALVAQELLPRAPEEGGLGRYPDGAAVYALLVRQQTTTELTPQAIHAIGRRELERLRQEMHAVMREMKWSGSFEAFVQHMRSDPRWYHPSPEALLEGYRAIAKRIDPELPRLFAELPRAPYGVQAMPAHMGANRAEYYNGPALDGSRGGLFFANTQAYRKRPIWAMETLVAHEAVPGHHLQIARATELQDLPPFRRGGFDYTAFTEGWALYAETLGFELGLFRDPAQRYGHLQWQAFRAARLVVDTGLHAMGWTRAQAIAFMTEHSAVDAEFIEGEVDRYLSSPGQALAYMIGKLEFDALRERARKRLGAGFDIRRFHSAVLDQGALPLATLGRVVDEWIEREAARLASVAPAAASATATAAPTMADDGYRAEDLSRAAALREAGLRSGLAYELVRDLTTEVGPRAAGSAGDAAAVAWAQARLRALGFPVVRAEPVPLQAWRRGEASARITAPFPQPLVVTALGGSVSTPPGGIAAEVAYYPDLAALRADRSTRAAGRIVFIDQKMQRTRDGAGYGQAVAARALGAIEAARRGALAVVIRSIGTDHDRVAHTGAMRYDPALPRIAALAVSVPDADLIARQAQHPATATRPLALHLQVQAQEGVAAQSANVVAEIPGTDLADEVVLLGAHLDSWDTGQGAIDDAAGVGIVTAAAQLLLEGPRPRRTVRVVLFANEEHGFDGARAYAERHAAQVHQWVGESDFGAGRVWRLRSQVRAQALAQVARIARELAPLGIAAGDNAGTPGPDAALLMRVRRWPGLELSQDGSDYFDWHHTPNDTLDKVDPLTLPQNVAAWAVATWLAAQSPVPFGPLPPAPEAPAR